MQYEGVIAGMVENGLKHTTPKYSQNKIWAVKNLGNNVRTSVFAVSIIHTVSLNTKTRYYT